MPAQDPFDKLKKTYSDAGAESRTSQSTATGFVKFTNEGEWCELEIGERFTTEYGAAVSCCRPLNSSGSSCPPDGSGA